MKNIKIGKLLALGFSLPVIALIFLVFLSMSKMDTINEQSTIISTNWLPSVELVERINTQTADLRNSEAVHIISTDSSTISNATAEINKIKNKITVSVNAYIKLISSQEEQALIDNFNTQYNRYLTIQKDLLALSEQNENIKAKELFLNESLKAYNDYSNTLIKLSHVNEAGAKKASEYGDVIYSSSINILIITVILLVIGIFVIAFMISTNMVTSITTIQNAMTKMSEGDMIIRIPDQGDNELGLLAECFNKTAEKMSSQTVQLISVAENVASSSNNLASVMTQADTNSQHMLMQVEQAATAINELSSTALEISRNATDAETSTVEANTNVTNGNHYLELSDSIAEKISSSVNESAVIVNELKDHSNEIGSVIDVINGISQQTNLLALNAAIEAARAGEKGRGFAVVADEVRSLAAKTQKSTVEIQEIITMLQTQVQKADEYMHSNSQLIIESQEIAIQVRGAFNGISESVQAISDMNSQVATASTEQSSVTDEVSQNITQVVDMVNQNVAGISESSKESLELSQQSKTQKEILSYYKIS